MLQIIATTFLILYIRLHEKVERSLEKKKSYQYCTESSRVPAPAIFGICWQMPFLVSFWEVFCSKEEELRKYLELQNTLSHEI